MARVAHSSRSALTSLAVESLERFCGRHGVAPPFAAEHIRAGRNSEVSRLSNKDGEWLLKNYYHHSGNQHDRLGTEFSFLVFLEDAGVPRVAQPLGMDRTSHRALYSFLPGKRPNAITPAHISQAANFIREINRFPESPGAMALPMAADACLSWQDHIDLTEERVRRLMTVRAESELEVAAHAFVTEQLLLLWSPLKTKLEHEIDQSQMMVPLPIEARIISPSDFGFHNTLESDGCLSFVDFEYAGWDDPAKLICDFICQPELPITERQGRQFMDELLRKWPHADTVRHRVDKLLPAHRLKWCCILLNEFRAEDRNRRLHAGVKSEGLLANQLSKAKRYFKIHVAPLT